MLKMRYEIEEFVDQKAGVIALPRATKEIDSFMVKFDERREKP